MQLNREIFFDGACLPVNPNGIACWGVVAKENGKTVCEKSGIVSRRGTNNCQKVWHSYFDYLP